MFTALILTMAVSYSPPAFDVADKLLLSSLAIESVFDITTTEYNLKHGLTEEADPVLGRHPCTFEMWSMGILANVFVISVSKLLPNPYRKIFEAVILAGETTNIISNFVLMHKAGHSFTSGFRVSF